MFIKSSLAVALVFGSAVIIVWSSTRSTTLHLTAKGNDELGIKLELPYGADSPADVVITNNSSHNLLAYKIHWSCIKYNGEVVERQSIKYHPLALSEKNQDRRMELLANQPLLAPHTKWFVGLGRENRQITGKTPKLDEVGRDPQLFPDLKAYKQINVTLDGIILENGQVIGRDPAAFEREINKLVSEYSPNLQEMNK
jgi:hypothetical protein